MVNKLSGCIPGIDNNGNIVTKPLTFLGGTVLSFNASLGVGPTQESTLSVEIINDCEIDANNKNNNDNEPGGLFYGAVKIGGPAFFSVCEAMNKSEGSSGCFEFGGIITNVSFEQNGSGEIYRVTMVDPRSLLENFTIVTGKNLSGPIKHRNYFNAFGYYEHNVLPEAFKYKDAENDEILLDKSPGSDNPITDPEGDDEKVDCEVFGKADSNDRGMSYRKVLQALLDDNDGKGPMVYSPNYGEPYSPPVVAPFDDFLNNRTLHEGNVFRLDLSNMPDPPQYYRVGGPSITLLQFITEVCDLLGREFIVTLEKDKDNNNGEPFVIKIQTKKIEPPAQNIFSQIVPYQGASTNLSYGKELRIDKSRYVLLGEQRHDIYQSADIDFYFGEDSNGDPIIPRHNQECGFEIDIEINSLNASLNCPLFDLPENGNPEGSLLERKVTITEYDIRTALASLQSWKLRVGNPSIPGDFNKIIRYNYPNLESELMTMVINQIGSAGAASATALGMRAFADAANVANAPMVATLAHNQAKDIEIIHNFIANIGKTYYGKQYIVTLDGEMCVKPAGLYDENYLRIREPGEEDTGTIDISTSYECEEEDKITVTIKDPLQVIKEKTYSHIPTNAGGWWEKCDSLLGLSDAGADFFDQFYDGVSLGFFRGEDSRIQSFARFDSSDVVVKFASGFGHIEPDSELPFIKPTRDIIEKTIEGEVIQATCGALDTSGLNPEDYLAIRKNGGICTPPERKPIGKNNTIPGTLIKEDKEFIQEPISLWMKCEVEEKLYIHDDKPKCVIKFAAPCLKKLCGDQNLWHEALLFASEAIGATSGLLAPSGTPGEPPTPTGVAPSGMAARSTQFVCGIPMYTGLMQSQSAIDASSINSKGFFQTAEKPSAVAIPVRNNLMTYGPWYSKNFKKSSGGVRVDQDSDLAPWVYGSTKQMYKVAKNLLKEAEKPLSEIETGSIDYPYWPELKLGFLENGPNLTSINVVFGGNGINTNYNFQSYTPKFGKLGNLENQQLKESAKNRQKLIKLIGQKDIEKNKIERKLKKLGGGPQVANANPSIDNGGGGNPRLAASLQRVMCGEMYDFYPVGNVSGVFNQRTVVGTDTLEKSKLELRYDYEKKAYISLDGIFSPVSISGAELEIDKGHYLPRFVQLNEEEVDTIPQGSGYLRKHKTSPILPHPPFFTDEDTCNNLKIHNFYLNPLTNPQGIPYHSGDCLGHSIDMVGRENEIPISGQMSSFYNPTDATRYSEDYRFIAMKGPMVLHAWGYDIDGKPIPNFIDSEESAKSGIFINSTPSGENICATGLMDKFLPDWLQKPATWPVGPIDLRFDRDRGVWVSPQPHKIIVAKLTEDLEPYGEAKATIINEKDDKKYGKDLVDNDGKILETKDSKSVAKIIIVDRLGKSYATDTKLYVYYDAHTARYIIIAGDSNGTIRLGKIDSAWNKNSTKEVILLNEDGSDIEDNPTIEVMNYFIDIPTTSCNAKKVACGLVGSKWILISVER